MAEATPVTAPGETPVVPRSDQEPLTICQVLAGRGAGGLERHFVDLCNRLARRHRVVAVAHPEFRGRLDDAVLHEPLDLTGWRHHPLTLVRLARRLARHRPQVVHAQANKAAAMVGAVRRSLGGAALVATVHNLKRDNRMFTPFHRVIAVSRRTARQIPHGRTEVIYNGIEPPPARETGRRRLEETLGGAPAGPVALAVGRLVPAKGFDVLLRAWPGIDARLAIVGDGPERRRLERLVGELGLRDRVCLLGHRCDAPLLIAGADLLVIASRKEGFSYVLAEALCAGTVAVATRVPVAEELLPEGYLMDLAEPAMHARITQVLAAPDRARRDLAPVWDLARRELTVEGMVTKTEELYRRVLAERSAPRRH